MNLEPATFRSLVERFTILLGLEPVILFSLVGDIDTQQTTGDEVYSFRFSHLFLPTAGIDLGSVSYPILCEVTRPLNNICGKCMTYTKYTTCEWFICHMWVTHISHVSDSYITCMWLIYHMWVIHISHVSDSYTTCEWLIYHSEWLIKLCVSDSYTSVSGLNTHVWVTHIIMWTDYITMCQWLI